MLYNTRQILFHRFCILLHRKSLNNVKKHLKNADELLVGLEKEFIALTLTSYSYHVKLNVLENKIEEAFSIGKKGIMLLDDLLQENIKVEPLITEQIILSYQIAIISEYPNSISGADFLHTVLRFLKSRLGIRLHQTKQHIFFL